MKLVRRKKLLLNSPINTRAMSSALLLRGERGEGRGEREIALFVSEREEKRGKYSG